MVTGKTMKCNRHFIILKRLLTHVKGCSVDSLGVSDPKMEVCSLCSIESPMIPFLTLRNLFTQCRTKGNRLVYAVVQCREGSGWDRQESSVRIKLGQVSAYDYCQSVNIKLLVLFRGNT